jgi:transposase
MVHLYLEGYSIGQIAVRLGRSYTAIVARLKQYEFTEGLEG